MASIKGRLFEFFVYRLLVTCGFKPVVPDGLLVYKGGPGLMVQGCGQPHNADVLLSPPIQTPIYYPTRLVVECKCYNQAIGLPQIRNALGLRDDINNFEIVTEEILQNRKSKLSSVRIQTFLTSHSAHIANTMEFAKVRYAQKSNTGVIYKNLNSFAQANSDNVDFIRKYLTLTKCDLFFADKAIFVEGASERLLLPDMIEKCEQGEVFDPCKHPLSAQYYALIEIGGAYAHKFIPFVDFLGLPWQTIYQSNKACGMIEHDKIQVIKKGSNFRSSPRIVKLLNDIRPDLPQKSAIDNFDGEVVVITCDDFTGERRTGRNVNGDLPILDSWYELYRKAPETIYVSDTSIQTFLELDYAEFIAAKAFLHVFDSTFYGLGKTNYMLFESVVTNTVYYGIAFVLYATGLWTPTLTGIALLFGIGNAFDSLVSAAAYAHLLKKQKINILKVEELPTPKRGRK